MRVLNASSNDYANMSHNNAKAIRSVGTECRDIILSKHPFNYSSQSELIGKADLSRIVKDYDVVQIFHTCPVILDLVKQHPNKVVYHTGTRYREQPQKFNELFNPYVYKSITDHCEFMHLGAKNISYLAPHNELLEVQKHNDKLVVGHYPSNDIVKGTAAIESVLEDYKDFFDIRINRDKVSHDEQVKRIIECDIYIELFKPTLYGQEYAHFGVSAFEATGLGSLTLTQNSYPNEFEKVYGKHPFVLLNELNDIRTMLDLCKDRAYFEKIKSIYHKDFHDKFSIEKTGQRILELIK